MALHVRHIPSYLWSPSFLLKPVSRTLSMHMFGSNAPILVKLLPLLPNLETLEVLAEDNRESDFENFFKRVKLPQVRKLLVDTHTHYVMKCCANVESLVVIQRFGPTYLKSIPFVAGSLVHLVLCLPAPGNIEGAGVPYYHR